MDYSQLDANINGNINTGNINTNDFLAIFSSTTVSNATLLDPPLLTVDGAITTLSPNNYVNDSYYFVNSNFYNSSSILNGIGNYSNQTLTGVTANLTSNVTEVQWDGRYPSGYTLPQIVIASVIVTILMIIIVVGNMLVIIAIATEKSLKNIQNWFIASLAVADFFLGLIIMPFSLANELMGYWIFGSWWCDIHSAMDVLLCTASIMNLCLISLDRYWSITKAVDYLKSRTPARAAIMIAAVWIMSALICIPPLLGWKKKMPEGPLPKCAVSDVP
ncbi:PREDICTED: alpha-2 adrenergic receptor [Rhagoletis zephyria]|uniref:alpha-2 adrenergic receptor n=1 Tax=Rhagoletis zephyria TaxID=28612 RepID=UPI0008117EEE|nr:PREDICTED: alpha-2 adrenergic receptor [Rhagoletis zephyria]